MSKCKGKDKGTDYNNLDINLIIKRTSVEKESQNCNPKTIL